ncbi:MAG: nicotinate-nucleotide adenylyltransferase [Butyrivibrio sp.]|nr:nicotinate-nucleotide adenylyltransferase [Butyrivibrio sp.]
MASGKIGILIGTFDPIHNGHLLLGESAREQFSLDRVIFIPANLAHLQDSTDISSGEDRFEMVKLAIKDNPYFKCSRIEIDKPNGTYTYDTVQEIKNMYPGEEVYLILGADDIFDITNWYKVKELFDSCSVLVAARREDDLVALDKKRRELSTQYNADIQILTFNRIDLSATDIRKRISIGRSIRYMVPEDCIGYICLKGLYK